MNAPRPFSDRHILITGAGSGIGAAIAKRLAAGGATVSLLGRRVDALRNVATRCEELGGRAVVQACDVRDPTQVHDAVSAAARAAGPLFAAIANAGVGGPNEGGDGDRWDTLIATNLSGTYHCFRAAVAQLLPGPEPRHLIAMSSILGRIGVGGYTGYCASKAGVLGLVRAFAMELAPTNVQVNAICPGWVETEMAWDGLDGIAAAIGGSRDAARELAMRAVPLRRMGKPEEIAGTVAWMLSADARGLTGQGIDVNGGAYMI